MIYREEDREWDENICLRIINTYNQTSETISQIYLIRHTHFLLLCIFSNIHIVGWSIFPCSIISSLFMFKAIISADVYEWFNLFANLITVPPLFCLASVPIWWPSAHVSAFVFVHHKADLCDMSLYVALYKLANKIFSYVFFFKFWMLSIKMWYSFADC